ncbi:uncharacterized protein LOC129314650 isoform X2 [Prosopis cineraria]|uniref:uncharacterized protein LOC129314650 isoform X2 n=1 Tax=Prosopis cineraria TaxID=364024 RepID=UPI00240EC3E6|nr:uncharacterized protein LOC129314650 isoform X2 [Prosopis cineraria]
MSSVKWPPLYSSPPSSESTKFGRQFTKPLHCSLLASNRLTCSLQIRRSATLGYRPSFKIFCERSKTTPGNRLYQGFSVLQGDSPWEGGNLWSTLAFYIFNLHIPLSFGGLSVVAQIIGKNRLVPQTEILAILFIQLLELNGALLLLKYTAKPQYKFSSFFKNNGSLGTRSWVLASAVGFGVLVLLLFLTSLVASRLFGSKVGFRGIK